MKESIARKEIVAYSKLLYERFYSVASEGNISVRLSKNRILITPSRLIKKFIEPSDLVIIDSDGKKLDGQKEPSSERYTHLEIYRQNPVVKAIVHAHPHYSVLLTALSIDPFAKPFLAEAVMFLQNATVAPYARPSTDEGAISIRELCVKTQALLIDRHGSFTYGADLFTAFSLLEILEKNSKMVYQAQISGIVPNALTADEIERLKTVKY